jgi:hypothetical protein
MKVVRHDRIADEVDPEDSGKLAEPFFDPGFSVVEILPEMASSPMSKKRLTVRLKT